MINEKILKKVIKKAIKNGFDATDIEKDFVESDDDLYYGHYMTIFSHDFAKAFWGEKEEDVSYIEMSDFYENPVSYWKRRMVEMVLEKDRIKYLEQFLDIE